MKKIMIMFWMSVMTPSLFSNNYVCLNGDDNHVPQPIREQGEEQPCDYILSSYGNSCLSLTFLVSLSNVSIMIYRDGQVVLSNYYDNINGGAIRQYNFNLYGSGQYTVCICIENNIEYVGCFNY